MDIIGLTKRRSGKKKQKFVLVDVDIVSQWQMGMRLRRTIELDAEAMLYAGELALITEENMKMPFVHFVPADASNVDLSFVVKALYKSGKPSLPVHLILEPDGNMSVLVDINKVGISEKRGEKNERSAE